MENSLKEEFTAKSLSIKNNNNISSISIYNSNDNNLSSHPSKENQKLNEKIVKLFIGNHPLLPKKTIRKIIRFNFMKKYLKNEFYYNSIIIDHIIHNDPGHIVAGFKDFLIMGDFNEFFQNYYKLKESIFLLPKIYDYYISCSVIFPNYVILPENQYIYKNIQRKQRVIDEQQDQEDKEENIKKGLIKEEKNDDLFTSQVFDSILNQTDTSGMKQYFEVATEGNSLIGQLSKIIDGINYYENNKISNLKTKYNNCLHKNNHNINLNESNNNMQSTNGINNDEDINNLHKKQKTSNYIKINYYNNNEKFFKKKNVENNKMQNIDNSKSKTKSKKGNNTVRNNNNVIQLSNSIRVINEISLNSNRPSNILTNGISSKNIVSRNKHYNKSKNYDTNNNNNIKDKKKGRNILGILSQDNNNTNYFTSTNSNGGGITNFINSSLNSKCNTSRQFSNREKINEIIRKSKKLDNSKNKSRNLYKSDNDFCNPKSLHIIKKSLIHSLLNSTREIEAGNKTTKKNNNKIILYNINKENKENNRTSMNATIFESIVKKSLNNSKNKFNSKSKSKSKKNYKMISIKNINEKNSKKNNESDYFYYKNENQLFSGFTKNIIYHKKQKNEMSSYRNKNQISKNNSIKNIKTGYKIKNNSSNNILGYKSNLSKSNISYSLINRNIANLRENQKLFSKKLETTNPKDKSGNIMNKKNKNKIINNIFFNKMNFINKDENKLELNNPLDNFSNGNNEIERLNKSKEKIDNIIIKPYKNEKSNKFSREHYGQNNSNKSKIKISCSNVNINKKKTNSKYMNRDDKKEKKISEEKNLRISCLLCSPNNLSYKKFSIKSDLRERKLLDEENKERPLTMRESLVRNDINNEAIEMLTNKINKIKQYMRESDKNDANSISHIFKKKKINKNVTSTQNLKTRDEFYNNNCIERDRTRTRNILINSNMNNTMINNINSGKIIKNIYINKNLINKSKKNNNIETKQKTQINYNYINSTNSINSINSNSKNKINNKRNNNNKIKAKHCRYYSNYVINNGINYFSEINNDIHNNKINIGKDNIYNNMNEPDIKFSSKNEIDKTLYNINKSGKNIIFLNNDMKSCSLKVLPVNEINQNKIIVSGININGFQKLVSKKFNTRNADNNKAATDRLKIINGSSLINNSNKFNITSINNRSKYDQKINRNKLLKSN